MAPAICGGGDSELVSEPTYKFKGARDRQTSQQKAEQRRNYLVGNILSPSSRIYQGKKYMKVFYETDVRHSREMSKVVSGPF